MPPTTNQDIIAEWSAASSPHGFGDEGDFSRTHLLNPTIFAMLGDVRAKRILDAGCGGGYLSRMLARRGAVVTGLEPAVSFYEAAVARERDEPLGVTYVREDLSMFRSSGTFDVVVSNMVLIDIPDYQSAMANCVDALRSGGEFIFSLQHPCFEESSSAWTKGFVEVREYLGEHEIPQPVGTMFHRPLSHYINQVIALGCALKAVVEPGLVTEPANDVAASRNAHVPSFIVLQAEKS